MSDDDTNDDEELMSELKRGEDPLATSGGIDWGDYSDRERVEAALVTELEPVTVGRIADVAGLEEERVEDILGILSRDSGISRVRLMTKDGEKRYEVNPVALFLDEVVDLVEDARDKEGLEQYLADLERTREEKVGKRAAAEDE